MKVLLIQPPIEDFYDTAIRTYPLGLLYVAARVADIADVALLDARTGKRYTLPRHQLPELTPYYTDSVSTPFSFFSRYSHYGMTRDEIANAVVREDPDVVGIGSMCSAYEKQAREVAETVKKVRRDMVTVMGGVHPTLFPEHILRDPNVDYCIRGEGETPFFELVAALIDGRIKDPTRINGLCFKNNGTLHISESNMEINVDILPRRSLVRADDYRISKRRYAFLLTSRGCPFSCGFCGKPPFPYRRRSLSSIEEEIEECKTLGIEAIDFEDDMLNLDRSFFTDVLSLFTGRDFTLSAMNGIYPGNMDLPTLAQMDKAGFRRLNFSLVDIAPSVLDGQNRKEQQSFICLLPFLESSPFLVEVHFIIGLPGQEPQSLLDTLLFLMERRLLLGPSIFYLSPGSAICGTAGGDSDIPFDTMRSSFMIPFNPLFPRTVTFTFVKLVRFINYTKQVIDRNDTITRASDLLDGGTMLRDEQSQTILRLLLHDKRLVRYDARYHSLTDEPVEQRLIKSFFEKAKGKTIKGYRSNRSLVLDV
jgi:anaerobic magnesium-protoporphyrin IX monomethyl ester cyclase